MKEPPRSAAVALLLGIVVVAAIWGALDCTDYPPAPANWTLEEKKYRRVINSDLEGVIFHQLDRWHCNIRAGENWMSEPLKERTHAEAVETCNALIDFAIDRLNIREE